MSKKNKKKLFKVQNSSNSLSARNREIVLNESVCDVYVPKKNSPLQPSIRFFQHLLQRRSGFNGQSNFVTQSKLKLNVPHTVLFGVCDKPVMYFTDSNGNVVRVDSVEKDQIISKLTKSRHGPHRKERVVVKKQVESNKNSCEIITYEEVKEVVSDLLEMGKKSESIGGGGEVILQRFVVCKGSKACVSRFVLHKQRNESHVFMITNNKEKKSKVVVSNASFNRNIMLEEGGTNFQEDQERQRLQREIATSENQDMYEAYKVSGRVFPTLKQSVSSLVVHIDRMWRKMKWSPGRVCTTQVLVCDFIRDGNNRWWFVQCKGLKMSSVKMKKKDIEESNRDKPVLGANNEKSYIKLKPCKMCLNYYSPNVLVYRLSLKMIYATECHLKQRSVSLPWFDRPEFNSVTDTSMWYESHMVCKNCFDMYLQEKKLSKVEKEFARAIGIPVKEKATENASILKTLSTVINTSFNEAGGGAGDSSSSSAGKYVKFGKKKKLVMYRLITYLKELRNIPETIDHKFFLKTRIFDIEQSVSLEIRKPIDRNELAINKLRVYYFFAENDDVFKRWIEEKKNFVVRMIGGGNSSEKKAKKEEKTTNMSTLGVAKLPLKQFGSGLIDKLDFMVLFSSSELKLCTLKAIVGFVKMKEFNPSNIALKKYQNKLYLPNPDFFTADPLPEEWMEVIPSLSEELSLDKLAKVDKTLKLFSDSEESKNRPRALAKSRPRKRPETARIFRRKKTTLTRVQSARKQYRRNTLGISFAKKQDSKKDNSFKKRKSHTLTPGFQPVFSSVLEEMKREADGTTLSGRVKSRTIMKKSGSSSSSLKSSTSARSKKRKKKKLSKIGKKKQTRKKKGSQKKKKNVGRPSTSSTVSSNVSSTGETTTGFKFKSDERIYKMLIRVGDIFELNSPLDETWTLSYKIFSSNQQSLIHTLHDSFQLETDGPLRFDVVDSYYLVCTDKDFLNCMTKNRLSTMLKVFLERKYETSGEIRMGIVDVSRMVGKKSLEETVRFEIVSKEDEDLLAKEIVVVENMQMNHSHLIDDDMIDDDEEAVDEISKNQEVLGKCGYVKVKIEFVQSRKVSDMPQHLWSRIKVMGELKEYNLRLVNIDEKANEG